MIHNRYIRKKTGVHSAHSAGAYEFRRLILALLTALVLISSCLPAFTQTPRSDVGEANVRIGVLGLFRPLQFTISAPPGHALVVHARDDRIVLERSSGLHTASVRLSESEILLQAGTRILHAPVLTIAGRQHEPVDFVLAVPGKIARRYHGTLEIKRSGGHLLAIVAMERETAVASIVAAESTSDTPLEALKAQAVATRSYLAASHKRHHDFDFCDTTHCQFLREPPAPSTPFARAVEATRGIVLAFESDLFAAMYTRSCGGRTRRPVELGLAPARYPYYSVECEYCRAHPVRWSSRISTEDADTLRSSDEPSRLRAARHLGWNTIPSNDFIVKKENGQIVLEGIGQGHGIGLCQAGAKAMAAEGADFRQILSYYYPNTTLVSIYTVADSLAATRKPSDPGAHGRR